MKLFDPRITPDLLAAPGGQKISSQEEWERLRRPEIVEFFTGQVFGRMPENPGKVRFQVTDVQADALDGTAERRTVEVRVEGPLGSWCFPFWMFVPKTDAPCGALVLICNRSKEENLDITRAVKSPFWPVEEIVARGYAAVAFHNESVDTDTDDGFVNGVHHCFAEKQESDSWATIAAWAFGAMRVMDYLQDAPEIDNRRIGVVGHSRGGKTALLTGMLDTRYQAVYSSCSGCVGAAMSRFKGGEHFAEIVDVFPFWFCEDFRQFVGREREMAFDQHMLLATIAPRLLYVGSATEDDWADPDAELTSAKLAGAVYRLYGMVGLEEEAYPVPDKAYHGQGIGYHRRTGEHNLVTSDWMHFIDFLEQRW